MSDAITLFFGEVHAPNVAPYGDDAQARQAGGDKAHPLGNQTLTTLL